MKHMQENSEMNQLEDKLQKMVGNVFITYVAVIILLLTSMLPVGVMLTVLMITAVIAGYFCNKQFIKQFTVGIVVISCIIAGLSAQEVAHQVFAYLGSLVRGGILSF